MLPNIKIRTKVLTAFAAVLCCTISLGLFAAQRLAAVNSAAAEIREGYLPSTRILGEIDYYTMHFRQLEATSALAPDAEARAKEEASLRKVQEQAQRAFASYEPLVHAGEERRLADEMKRAWASYLDLDAKFLTLSRAQDGHDAVSAYRGEMRTVFNRFQDVLQAGIALNVKQSGLAADRGATLGGSTQRWILAVLGMMAGLCVAIGWSIIRGISVPLTAMTSAMRRLADRDVTVAIPGVGRGDEIGGVANAVQVFKDNMIRADQLAAEQESERAGKEQRAARLAEIVQGFEAQIRGMVGQLSSASTELEAAARSMTETASQTNNQATAVAAAAEEASAGVQTVAAASEELTASINEISRQIAHSAQMTGRAATDARRTDATVRVLAAGAEKIGQAVELIAGIAGQTNLLALNATIEAARARRARASPWSRAK